jgi:hypothetical protein
MGRTSVIRTKQLKPKIGDVTFEPQKEKDGVAKKMPICICNTFVLTI